MTAALASSAGARSSASSGRIPLAHLVSPSRPSSSSGARSRSRSATRSAAPVMPRPASTGAMSLDEMRSPSPRRPVRPMSPLQRQQQQMQMQQHTQRRQRTPEPPPHYEYDLYPSQTQRRPSPRRASPSKVQHQEPLPSRSQFYPVDASSALSSTRAASSLDATAVARANQRTREINASPPRVAHRPRPASPEASAPFAVRHEVDLAATQRRIRSLMEEQNARSVGSLSASGSSFAATRAAQPSHPLTSSARAARGARSMEEIKRDVALRMADHSHPEHRLNHPRAVDAVLADSGAAAAGSFHLSHHSAHGLSATTGGDTRLSSAFTHPLPADGVRGDRRAQGILNTAHTASVNLTQNQLRANAVPRSEWPVEEEKQQSPPAVTAKAPFSFFPMDSSPASSPSASASAPHPASAKSAYLATMHAGALRVEHLLRQPKMQVMLDALLPATLAREAVEAAGNEPPIDSGSNVDRLLYDTITGKEERRNQIAAGTAAGSFGASAAAASLGLDATPVPSSPRLSSLPRSALSPPSHDFSRSALLQREARLDALLALSSPQGADHVPRMSYDSAEVAARKAEEAAAQAAQGTYFDTRSVLGPEAQVQAGTVAREALVEGPRAALDAQGLPFASAMDAVMDELLGSPTRRTQRMRLSNGPEAKHAGTGGVSAILGGVKSPLRLAMANVDDTTVAAATSAREEKTRESPLSTRESLDSLLTQATMAASSPSASSVSSSVHSASANGSHTQHQQQHLPAVVASADDPHIRISSEQLEYLEGVTSFAPAMRAAELEEQYQRLLSAKCAEACFVREQREERSLFAHWRAVFLHTKERNRVMLLKRHEDDIGHQHFQRQQAQTVEEIAAERFQERRAREAQEIAAGLAVRPSTPEADSALLADVPQRSAAAGYAAAAQKTFIAESSSSRANELLASIHCQAQLLRRVLRAWGKHSRIERLAARAITRTRALSVRTWFRNWRDLMRIVRGEYHMWVAGKEHDAQQEMDRAQEDEQERWHQRERARVERTRMLADDRQFPEDIDTMYAHASAYPLTRPLPSHSAFVSAEDEAQQRGFSGAAYADSRSVQLQHQPSASSVAPLTAHLHSAYTREQFSSHQESIYRARRSEEELRLHFAALRAKVDAPAATVVKGATGGPLLFQLGSSIQRPAFIVDAQAKPVQLVDTQRNWKAAPYGSTSVASSSPLSPRVTLSHMSASSSAPVPLPLSSPIHTSSGGVLHQVTGSPQLDRHLIRPAEQRVESPVFASAAAASEARGSPSPARSSASPARSERGLASPVSTAARDLIRDFPLASGRSASPPPERPVSPLRPPAFLQPTRRRDSSRSPPASSRRAYVHPTATGASVAAEPLSPVRPHVRPNTPTFHASGDENRASATTHGFLPVAFARSVSSDGRSGTGASLAAASPSSSPLSSASTRYYASSHWQAPAPSRVTDDELRANVRVAAQMKRDEAELRASNQQAQWRRIELEKEHYRNKVQQQHEAKA